MQNDNYTDFDLELKRMLRDAEETVPPRIWDAVSSELDRRDRRKVVALRWRRAAIGVAAAAVLSGIFVFLGRDTAEGPSLVADSSDTVQVTEIPAQEEAIPDIEEQIAATGAALADVPGHRVRSAATATVPSEVASAPVSPVVEESPIAPVEDEAEERSEVETSVSKPENVTSEPTVRPSVPATRPVVPGTLDDPFAWPEEEDAEDSGRKPSFTLSGNAMTNDFSGTDIRQMRIPSAGVKTRTGVEEKGSSTFDIPVTFGVGVRFNLSDRWALGTGVNWSKLSRTFNGVYTEVNGSGDITRNINSEIVNDIHYIGVPLNLYFNIFDSRNLRFYAWGGGSAEKGLTNRFRIQSDSGDIFYKEAVNGLQWSAGAGLGLEFLLGEHFGLYLDPSARYYFDCGQPVSIRTKRPFMMNYEVGIRFNL